MTPKLYGPFPLTDERIDDNVVSSPGVYALGYTRGDEFVIAYLGRADNDLATELTTHVRGTYPLFKFAYALSAEDAFAKQCELYHRHQQACVLRVPELRQAGQVKGRGRQRDR